MRHLAIFGIGIIAGILISFSYPEPAMAVNETFSPLVQEIVSKADNYLRSALS